MAGKWVSFTEVEKRLIRAAGGQGAESYAKGVMAYLVNYRKKKALPEDYLVFAEKAIRKIGVKPFYAFVSLFIGSSMPSASMQFKRKYFSGRAPAGLRLDPSAWGVEVTKHLAKKFFRPVSGIINAPGIKKRGYRLELGCSFDRPMNVSFMLVAPGVNKDANPLARFNVDFYLDRKGRPCVVLGNMQGGRKNEVDAFKAAFGESPLDFFIRSATKAFGGRARAFNPKKADSIMSPNRDAVLYNLCKQGLITEEEKRVFYRHENGQLVSPAVVKKVGGLLEQEEKAIKSRGVGMHFAAYKKAGFAVDRKKTRWRPRKPLA